jgi:UDP:flavonoid glycosyltransferase YjiC (YdhE family)
MKIGIQTWGSEGDVRPFIALAGGLSARGHDVTLAVSDVNNKQYSDFAERLKFKIKHIGHHDYDEEKFTRLGHEVFKELFALKQLRKEMYHWFDPIVEEIYRASKLLCEENDIVIGHFLVYPLKIAAEKTNRKNISVFLAPAIPSDYIAPPDALYLGKFINSFYWKIGDILINRLFGPSINKMRIQESLQPVNNVQKEAWSSQTLNLVAVSPSLSPQPPDWDSSFRTCGFFNISKHEDPWKPEESLKRFLKEGPPPVYVTFGSIGAKEYIGLIIDAIRLANCRAIVQTEWNDINMPEHPDIYRITRASHQHIFPYCAAVVHHGGAGTTQIATLSGCPSVVVRFGFEQELWGNILRKVGIAPKLLHRRSVTAKKLSKAIKAINSEMSEKAKRISYKMQREDGVKIATKLIENLD